MTTIRSTHTRSLATVALVALTLVLTLLVVTADARAAAVTGGKTTIVLDPVATPLFYAVSYSLYPIAPATLAITPSTWKLTLPISGGSYAKASHTGTFKHRGGHMYLRRSGSAWLQHRLASSWILVNGAPEVTAFPNGGVRANILSADLSTATFKHYTQAGRKWVKISNVKLAWTTSGSSLFSAVFSQGVTTNLAFGTATIDARL